MEIALILHKTETLRPSSAGDCAARVQPLYELKIMLTQSSKRAQAMTTVDANDLEAASVFGEAGISTGFMDMTIGAGTAPATVASNAVLANAEVQAPVLGGDGRAA